MADAITIKALQDASLDAKSLEEVVNGDEVKQVTTRLGETYPSVKKAIKTLFENGGLPAAPFATKALMTASAMADGSYAMVTDDSVLADNGLYQKVSGVWGKSNYDPLTQAMDYTESNILVEKQERTAVVDSTNMTENAIVFVGEDGRVGAAIDVYGNMLSNNIYANYDNSDIAYGVVDESGGYALIVDKAGKLHTAVTDNLRVEMDSNSDRLSRLELGDVGSKITLGKTDYMHLFSYGQSLSRGQTALPILSTTQPYENVTFLSGVLPRGSDVTDYTGFKPLVEMSSGVEGETPISSMANNFVGYQVANGDSASNWKMVGTAPGRGARDIATLSKGQGNYTGLMEQVQAAYDLAQAQGKTYSVWAMAWTQGETDLVAPATSRQAYYNMLLKLRSDFEGDVKAITNQNFPPLTVMYQTCSHKKYEEPNMYVALAQLEAAENTDNIVIATPIYFLNNAPDTVHLTNNSSVQLGKYYAKALDYTLKNKDKWQPLKPKHITRQGKVLAVEFNKSGLVLDTTLVTLTHNHGFDIFSGGVLQDIITGVEIVDTDRVNITLSDIPPEGATLTYGKGRAGDAATSGRTAGARGNLRDNAGDTDNYVDSKGVTRYMHNWCVFFDKLI